MVAKPKSADGDNMGLSEIRRVIDNPWFRGGARLMMWAAPFVVGALLYVLGLFTAQVTSLRDTQSNMFGRLARVETSIGSIESTQSSRAADNERFQGQVLASLEGIKNDIVAIKINEASVNTLLREHFPSSVSTRSGSAQLFPQ